VSKTDPSTPIGEDFQWNLLIKETGLDPNGKRAEEWRLPKQEERDRMAVELGAQVAARLLRPTFNWVPSKRPHAFYPHIMIPCWVMEEVEHG
jgi:hypothetical protein